jgi:phosphoglycerate dehydrogenase-like enzyme
MSVHAFTLHPRNSPESKRDESYHPPGLGDPEGNLPSKWYAGSTTAELHEFLSSGLDLLVVSLPLTDKTRHLIGLAELELLGKNRRTFISNIARGAIINTDALIKALNSDVIRGAALDVTDPEPLPQDHELWKAKNIIITPHVSGASTQYSTRVLAILGINLERLSRDQELMNRVSRKDGY